MKIDRAEPPRMVRRNYERIVAAVVAGQGDWVRFRLSEFSGISKGAKQGQVLRAGYQRGVTFETRTRTDAGEDVIEVRLREGESASTIVTSFSDDRGKNPENSSAFSGCKDPRR